MSQLCNFAVVDVEQRILAFQFHFDAWGRSCGTSSAALSSRQRPRQSIPKAQSTIANGQVRRVGEAASLQIKEQFAPALGAFTIAVSQADDLFAAPLICPDQHQNALFFLS